MGSEIAHQLEQKNIPVVELRRSSTARSMNAAATISPTPDGRRRGRTHIVGDVTHPESLRHLPSSISEIVYAVSPDNRTDRAYQQAYPLGLGNVVAALPGRRTVLITSTAVYEQSGGALVTEASACAANTFSAIRMREAEQVAKKNGSHAVLRASGIYGPGRTSLVQRLVHEELSIEQKSVWTNRIHQADLAQLVVTLLLDQRAQGTFLASDENPSQLGDMQDYLRGLPDIFDRIPPPDPRRQGRGTARRASRRISPTRFDSIGFSLRYPSYREGYAQLLGVEPARRESS